MKKIKSTLFAVAIVVIFSAITSFSTANETPPATREVVASLKQANWLVLEEGLDVMRSVTQGGIVLTAYRVSPSNFKFEIGLQASNDGSRVREIGEGTGAVLVTNGGFFAQRENGELYPIGYMRTRGAVLAKGWPNSGGLVVFDPDGPQLLPSSSGIPKTGPDILQTRPMLLEPGGHWAMRSNIGQTKLRTLLCRMADGDIVFVLITRVGLSLYEAGWVLRDEEQGGFFGCDSAVALDGGRSTQIWYSGDPSYSFPGFTAVQNFVVVRQKD